MKRHRLLYAASVVAMMLVAALVTSTGPGANAAVTGHTVGAVRPAPAPHKVNLHTAFERALGKTRSSYPRAGIVPPRGRQAPTSQYRGRPRYCVEPACDLSWQGGPVQHSPHIYILLWGPNWTNSDPGYGYTYWMFDSLGQSNDSWSTTTSQYCDGSGCPSFTGAVLNSPWQDSSTPPNPITPSDLAAEANAVVSAAGITDTADAQIVVMPQSGSCYSDGFAGSCGTPGSGSYCAWHSYNGTVSFTNLPYQLDAQSLCGENWTNSGSAGEYDGFTTVGGHEFAESVTDPQLNAWYDPAPGGGEIGDKCAWSDPHGDVPLTNGTFAMQSLWSNAWGQCVMTSAPYLDIFSPGNQSSLTGHALSLGIGTASNTDSPLTFSASGLPYGLSINSSTGTISGTPTRTAGTFNTRVVVSDYANISSTTFTWAVSSPAGPIKGYDAKCVDDYRGLTTNGNKIELYTCNNTSNQSIVFHSNGELVVRTKCITSVSGKAAIETCAHATTQTWTRAADGEYIVKSSKQCLTDPNHSTANGTQLVLAACNGTGPQRWSLP
jgi:hypothetical protein